MKRPIDAIIADKNQLVRAGLTQLLSQDERFCVRAAVSDGRSLLDALAEETPCDVAVLGWMLPSVDARGVLAHLRERRDAPSIVVYTGALDPAIPRHVMALGGAGFCSKREPPERLMEIMTAVADGQMVFPRFDVRSLYKDPFDHLTAREFELLAALAEGASNNRIAQGMGISLNTVKFHLKNLYEKLNVQNRASAVALYVANKVRFD